STETPSLLPTLSKTTPEAFPDRFLTAISWEELRAEQSSRTSSSSLQPRNRSWFAAPAHLVTMYQHPIFWPSALPGRMLSFVSFPYRQSFRARMSAFGRFVPSGVAVDRKSARDL